MMNDYHTAIVFQGGGALGAYECGVIKALYEERRNFKPAVVTGISIGAINAAILVGAKNDPVETLENVWRKRLALSLPSMVRSLAGPLLSQAMEQGLSAFGNAGMYQFRADFLAPRIPASIYDLEPLRRTLSELIDLDKLNRPEEIRLVVGAVNVKTGEARNFDNKIDRLRIDHVIASGSIPPMFPTMSLDSEPFWDGGLFQNTPLSSAINCLEQIPGDVRRELIVVELFPMNAPAPRNLSEVGNRLGQLIFASKLKIDRKLFQTVNQTIEFIGNIQKQIPAEFRKEFQNEPAYQEIFLKHKKIDALTVITAEFAKDRGSAGDFSEGTLDYRIKSGYEDAKKQNIGTPHTV
jgi:NTE family protein